MQGHVTDRKRWLAGASTRVRLRLASDEGLVASIRRGDPRAFEALYDRHSGELLSFCSYMLASRADAEDALQGTFAAAYRALRTDERPIALRAWLFAIARNQCLTILRRRRATVELNGEPALRGDPAHELEVREQMRDTLGRLRELPEPQRAALVLAELRGLSQVEIGTVLGVRTEQVKALVHQARSDLISERRARETSCEEIREELSNARGAALLRGRLRRHVRSCEDCRSFAAGVALQRRQLNSLLPIAPSLLLKLRALPEMLLTGISEPAAYAGGATLGGTVAGAALEFAGGGVKAIAVKVVAGAAMLGLSTGVGATVAPNQPLSRLAGEVTHVGAGAHAHSAGKARGGARGTHGSSSVLLARQDGGRGGAGAAARALGAGGGSSEGRGSTERGGGAGGSSGSHPAQSHHGKPATKGAERNGSAGAAGARAVSKEQRAQQREERKQQAQATHEQRRHAREERREAAPERDRSAEQRQREQQQHQAEREQSKRHSERQRSSAQRQREREKGKREREHLHNGEQRQQQHERAKRQRQRERERAKREREHLRRRGGQAPAQPAEEGSQS